MNKIALLLLFATLPLFGDQITLFGKVTAPAKTPELLTKFPPIQLLFNLSGDFKSFETIGTNNQLLIKIKEPASVLMAGLLTDQKPIKFKTFTLHPIRNNFYLHRDKDIVFIGSLPLLKDVISGKSLTFHPDLNEIISRYKLTDNFIAMVTPKKQKKLLKQLPAKSLTTLPPAKFTIENSAAILFTFKQLPKKMELKLIIRGEDETVKWFAQFFKANMKQYAPVMDQKLGNIETQTALIALMSRELEGLTREISDTTNALRSAYNNLRFKVVKEDLHIETTLPGSTGELIPHALYLLGVMKLKGKKIN